ncbi:hypothetical protein XELAEV_18002098mg [Xenopus laevis]|uniref:Uncharacterized protein n=1 Tax=Xenopus laevis TaxID=8355 RepID=A0A974GZA3_XENLA|nr:hypothetical protein XELAEV_18002098mg [Xenopus laevis]
MPGLGALTEEAAYELVSYLLTNSYDNVPFWVPHKRAHKRHLMKRLQRRLRRLCGLSFQLPILQRMWSDMKRREPEFVAQVELHVQRRGRAQAVQQEGAQQAGQHPQNVPGEAEMEEAVEVEAEEPQIVEEELLQEDLWLDPPQLKTHNQAHLSSRRQKRGARRDPARRLSFFPGCCSAWRPLRKGSTPWRQGQTSWNRLLRLTPD